MSSFWSRIVVSVVGLPVVLGVSSGSAAGGCSRSRSSAALVALHEFYSMTRPLRPLVLAGYAGLLADPRRRRARRRPSGWSPASLATLRARLRPQGRRGRRAQSVDRSRSATTVLGAAWVGLGLAHLVLLRAISPTDDGRLAVFTVLLAVFAADTFAYFGGRLIGRHRMAPTISPGKTWEGFVAGTRGRRVRDVLRALQDSTSSTIRQSLVLGAVIAVAAPLGDLFESALKRDMDVKDTGRLLGGPRRHARPHRRAALRGAGGVLRLRRLRPGQEPLTN